MFTSRVSEDVNSYRKVEFLVQILDIFKSKNRGFFFFFLVYQVYALSLETKGSFKRNREILVDISPSIPGLQRVTVL